MARVSGAGVILVNGTLAAFLRRRNPSLRVFLPDEEPERTTVARHLARKLAELALRRRTNRAGLLIGNINGVPAREHFLANYLQEAGFVDTTLGFQMRRVTAINSSVADETNSTIDDEASDISETA